MQVAIVKQSTLAKFGRWDAQFHIAYDGVKDRVAELEQTLDRDTVIARLNKLTLEFKAPLIPLMRGRRDLNTESATLAIKEYPFIALALIEPTLDEAVKAIRKRAREQSKATRGVIDQLKGLSEP